MGRDGIIYRSRARTLCVASLIPVAILAWNQRKPDFDRLTDASKRYVITEHDRATDYYKRGDYRDALFEVRKIFLVTRDYADSREIERYSTLALETPVAAADVADSAASPCPDP